MKDHQQQKRQLPLDESMSNLTSASGGEASASTGNGGVFHPPPPPKKKRSQPGHPDPDAEVVALSPRTLLATNRFVCEICSKGFQRDQNLQLHRRGHNLPWKLKQRTNKEVRKKVYVCPETSCVHHDPSRALGDLTGIKKHFYRKHGEKKWKCEKCSKKYAVQSDWKAHSKTCGTREYRCDCGTLFSRRDSFITHRAFCDALAEESARSIARNNIQLQTSAGSSHHINLQQIQSSNQTELLPPFSVIKKEQQNFILGAEVPPWLFFPGPPLGQTSLDLSQPPPPPSSNSIFADFHHQTPQDLLLFQQALDQIHNPNPNPSNAAPAPAHVSATALLQKAAEMGSKSGSQSEFPLPASSCTMMRSQQSHVSAGEFGPGGATDFGRNLLSSHGEFISGLASYGNKAAFLSAAGGTATTSTPPPPPPPPSFIQDLMVIEDMGGFAEYFLTHHQIPSKNHHVLNFGDDDDDDVASTGGNGGGAPLKNNVYDGMTRDFLGLRGAPPLSHSDILGFTGLNNCIIKLNGTSSSEQNQHG